MRLIKESKFGIVILIVNHKTFLNWYLKIMELKINLNKYSIGYESPKKKNYSTLKIIYKQSIIIYLL